MDKIIKTGFCVAYDWELLKYSLPRVYEESDIICLAIDKDRHSWSCNKYDFDDEAFYEFVKETDGENKIDIYEDDFSLNHLNARENCNRHRTKLADRMKPGGWHIQIDVDEYFIDFKGFVNYLKSIHKSPTGKEKPVNICANMVPVFKKSEQGYFYITFGNDKMPEKAPVATNVPVYERARNNGHFNHISPYYFVHETWARSEDELRYKLNNWGHSAEELKLKEKRESFLKLWKAIDKYNYMLVRDIHPAVPGVWPGLAYCEAADMNDFISQMKEMRFPAGKFDLWLRNNRLVAKIRSLIN